MSKVCTGIGSE